MDKKKTEILRRRLFGKTDFDVYAVLDGAAIPDLLDKINEHKPPNVCLFRGVEEDYELAMTAPYLVRLEAKAPFTSLVLADGLGKHWGIFALVPEDTSFVDLRKHFRNLLRAHMPNGGMVTFRNYDPRVCHDYLSVCDQEQLREFFGQVNSYLVENYYKGEELSELIEYSLKMGRLQQNPLLLVP